MTEEKTMNPEEQDLMLSAALEIVAGELSKYVDSGQLVGDAQYEDHDDGERHVSTVANLDIEDVFDDAPLFSLEIDGFCTADGHVEFMGTMTNYEGYEQDIVSSMAGGVSTGDFVASVMEAIRTCIKGYRDLADLQAKEAITDEFAERGQEVDSVEPASDDGPRVNGFNYIVRLVSGEVFTVVYERYEGILMMRNGL